MHRPRRLGMCSNPDRTFHNTHQSAFAGTKLLAGLHATDLSGTSNQRTILLFTKFDKERSRANLWFGRDLPLPVESAARPQRVVAAPVGHFFVYDLVLLTIDRTGVERITEYCILAAVSKLHGERGVHPIVRTRTRVLPKYRLLRFRVLRRN